MRISFSPQRRQDVLTVVKSGDILTIDGAVFDFSLLPDGATIPAEAIPSEWFVGPVERIDGVLHLTLVLPHGPEPSESVAFPSSLIDPPDGALALPNDKEPANVDA